MRETSEGKVYTQFLASVGPVVTRVAVLEDSRLVEIYIERSNDRDLVGNIYKGRVTNVVEGMQAAFVDVGLEHDVFLPVSDIHFAHHHVDGEQDGAESPAPIGVPSIRKLLHVGQEVLVQILKDPVGSKGARATTNITVPGRYLVLMPTIEHIGVSRKIEDEAERERLRSIAMEVKPAGMGLIVRTVAEGRGREDFVGDINYLLRTWARIEERAAHAKPYTLLYQDSDLVEKIVRDIFSSEVDEFIIDDREVYERIIEACDFLSPALKSKIRLYDGERSLFEHYGVEQEIEKSLNEKVWLPCGGYLVIQETEALVSIDVNTGRYLGRDSLEYTAYTINLEAAEQIARQVRLRNLAGMIVIDFIDMEEEEHRKAVVEHLKEHFSRDRAKTFIYGMSELGLVQMTRKRSRPALSTRLKECCPFCGGEGRILSREYVSAKVFRRIQEYCKRGRSRALLVNVHPVIARMLMDTRREYIQELERRWGVEIYVRPERHFHYEQFEILDKDLT